MAERKSIEISLNGETFKVYNGYTMAVLEAQTEAGGIPTEDMRAEWEKDVAKFILYASRFVQTYFQLMPDFMRTCVVSEIGAAFTAIMEATTRDPFGLSPQTPPVPPEPSKTSGS